MLHSLDFLKRGQQWPPKTERARLDGYVQNRRLYEGDHSVFGNWWKVLRMDTGASLEVVLNWHRRITNLWGDFVVGEPPVYKSDSRKEDLGALVERTRLNAVVREVVQDMSRFGDGLFKVRAEDGEARVEALSPEIWFPVVARENVRRVLYHVLAWTFEEEVAAGWLSLAKRQRYLRVEIHEVATGTIEHRLHVLDNNAIGAEVSPQRARELFPEWTDGPDGADSSLVVHVPNSRTSERLFGFDDYRDIDGLVAAMETRVAQIERILDKHADPAVAGPRIEEEIDEATGLPKPRTPADKYFVVQDGVQPPQYIVWNPQLDAAFRQIELLQNQIFVHAELSPVLFGVSETGYAESGTSLKLRTIAPTSKAARIRTELDPAVKQVVRLASSLEGEPIEDAEIHWKDGLPNDDAERAQTEANRVNARLASRRSALARLDGTDEEASQEEYDRMVEEEKQAQPGEGGELPDPQAIVNGLLGSGQGTDGQAENAAAPAG